MLKDMGGINDGLPDMNDINNEESSDSDDDGKSRPLNIHDDSVLWGTCEINFQLGAVKLLPCGGIRLFVWRGIVDKGK